MPVFNVELVLRTLSCNERLNGPLSCCLCFGNIESVDQLELNQEWSPFIATSF